MKLRNRNTASTHVQENSPIKPEENLNPKDFSRMLAGVTSTKIGGFYARMENPITKKSEGLGNFKSAEEASTAYLTKKLEFEKIVILKKAIQGVVCDEEIQKYVNQSDQCLENQDSLGETIDSTNKKVNGEKGIDQSDPCLENQDSRKQRISNIKRKIIGVDSRKAGILKKKRNFNIFEGKIAGVNKTKNGKYTARIKHPISKKEIWIGTFKSADEASMAYLNKRSVLEKEVQGGKEGIECKDNGIKKKDSPIFEGKIVMVKKTKSGKYSARIRHPITKKDIWIGTFRSFEEASMAYLAKKTELQNLLQGKDEEIEWAISEDDGINKSSDMLGPILEEINHDPCSDNQDSSMEKNIVYSESGAEIVLKTESGMPIMDSHGFLLGIWGCIDELSLPIVDDENKCNSDASPLT